MVARPLASVVVVDVDLGVWAESVNDPAGC